MRINIRIISVCTLLTAMLTTTAASADDDIVFYEGNNCTQQTIFSYNSYRNIKDDCKVSSSGCHGNNDEARSVRILYGIAKPIKIGIYDNRNGYRNDDYAIIDVVKPSTVPRQGLCIGTFERTRRNILRQADGQSVDIYFTGQRRGLDGKVSHISVSGR